MSFSNELTFKILALVLCDNIYLRVIILSFLLVRIFLRKEKAYKSWCDYFIGVLIVTLNSIFTFDFMIINFIVLGLLSGYLSKVKYSSFLSLYLFCVLLEGVVVFCLKI